nr:hypothetical protein [Rhizobium wenxiniae]
MLRLPRLRDAMKRVHRQQPTIENLFAAYDEASSALERMQTLEHPDPKLLDEYRRLCVDIEQDVADICGPVPLDRK